MFRLLLGYFYGKVGYLAKLTRSLMMVNLELVNTGFLDSLELIYSLEMPVNIDTSLIVENGLVSFGSAWMTI